MSSSQFSFWKWWGLQLSYYSNYPITTSAKSRQCSKSRFNPLPNAQALIWILDFWKYLIEYELTNQLPPDFFHQLCGQTSGANDWQTFSLIPGIKQFVRQRTAQFLLSSFNYCSSGETWQCSSRFLLDESVRDASLLWYSLILRNPMTLCGDRYNLYTWGIRSLILSFI